MAGRLIFGSIGGVGKYRFIIDSLVYTLFQRKKRPRLGTCGEFMIEWYHGILFGDGNHVIGKLI